MASTWGNRKGRPARKRAGQKLNLERLETRIVPDVRSITGFGNNLAHLTWGMGGIDLLRKSPVAYADGISAPSAPNNLNPRQISNDLSNQSNPIFSFADNLGNPNSRQLSDYAYAFGQFIDHDMDLTLDNSGQPFDIPASTTPGDPMGVEPFTRSQFDPNTGTTTPRQQINQDTAFLDLSQTYGSTDAVSSILRSHVGGRLRTSPGDFLPRESDFTASELATLNHDEGGIANDAQQVPDSQLFVAGDKRVNENVELISQQTLFMRNHNRLAGQIQAAFPSWTDEQIFQEARKLNIAEYQNIVYNGYLPSILGSNAIPAYGGYNPNINPGIRTEFSTVGFRFGHSLLSSTVGRDTNNGLPIPDATGFPGSGGPINLTEDFFRPDLLNNNHVVVTLTDRFGNPDYKTSSTVGEVLKALADGLPNEFDLQLIDEVRNILFGIPKGPGTDLAARDVQRARDHGIGTYNQVRVAYGLAPVTAFTQISSDFGVQSDLQTEYGTVDKIDPFIGMLAEDIIPGSDVGPTCRAILVHQFVHLRDGDRFYFQNESFNAFEQSLLAQGNSLSKVIKNNTSITNLQGNVFFNRLEISGHVFNDPDGDGIRQFGEPGIPGVTVELHDAATGVLVSKAVTDVNGEYDFTELGAGSDGIIPATGNYTLKLILPPGFTQNATQISHNPGEIFLSRGDLQLDGRNFAIMHTPGGAAAPTTNPPADLGSQLSAADAGMANILVGQPQAPAGTTTVVTVSTPQASGQVTQAPDVGTSGATTSQDAALLPSAGDPAATSSDSLSRNDPTANDPVVQL